MSFILYTYGQKVEKVRDIHFANYSEAASTRVQLAVLFTLAQLRIHAYKGNLIPPSFTGVFLQFAN